MTEEAKEAKEVNASEDLSAIKEDINQVKQQVEEATDPTRIAQEMRRQRDKEAQANQAIYSKIVQDHSDFQEVVSSKNYEAFKKSHPEEADDIGYIYESGEKERAYRQAYRRIKEYQSKQVADVPVMKKEKKEMPLPNDRDPEKVGGTSMGTSASPIVDSHSYDTVPKCREFARNYGVEDGSMHSLTYSNHRERSQIHQEALRRGREMSREMKKRKSADIF